MVFYSASHCIVLVIGIYSAMCEKPFYSCSGVSEPQLRPILAVCYPHLIDHLSFGIFFCCNIHCYCYHLPVVFLDIPSPWDAIEAGKKALRV